MPKRNVDKETSARTCSFVATLLCSCFSSGLFSTLLSSDWYRVIEMPYAYQCCVYGSCDSYKPAGQWDSEQSSTSEDLHKRTVAMYPIHTDTHCKTTHAYGICENIHTVCQKTCNISDGNLTTKCPYLAVKDVSDPH